MKRFIYSLMLLTLVLTACSPTFPLVEDTRTATPLPTWTAMIVDAPTVTPTFTPAPTMTPEPTLACLNIKGNVNAKGEKRYFMQESINYKNVKPEAMFCTEAEAQAAGFVKAGK